MNSSTISQAHAIMMVGLPGSGKTYFAKQFSEMFSAPFIESEYIVANSRDKKSGDALSKFILSAITKTHQTFIYESDNFSRARRAEFAKWAKANGYKPLFVWVQTDEATCRKRAQKEKYLDSEAFDTAKHSFTEPNASEKPVVISGKHTYKTQARTVLARLGDSNRPTRQSILQQRPDTQNRITIQ